MTTTKTSTYSFRASTARIVGIYGIFCDKLQKVYIGSSRNVQARIDSHFKYLAAGTHSNYKMQAAFNSLGKPAFRSKVIEICTEDKLLEREQYWIDRAKAAETGFNVARYVGMTYKQGEIKHKIEQAARKKAILNHKPGVIPAGSKPKPPAAKPTPAQKPATKPSIRKK